MKKIQTLCLIQKGEKILLGMKKRGFGQGRWNGFGGKVKEGETIESAAKRETLEESGITILSMEKVGVLEFLFPDNPDEIQVHFFRVNEFTGKPLETEEMKPGWYDIKNIPFDKMWPDDKFWMPLFLERKNFKGKFLFDSRGGSIVEHSLTVI